MVLGKPWEFLLTIGHLNDLSPKVNTTIPSIAIQSLEAIPVPAIWASTKLYGQFPGTTMHTVGPYPQSVLIKSLTIVSHIVIKSTLLFSSWPVFAIHNMHPWSHSHMPIALAFLD